MLTAYAQVATEVAAEAGSESVTKIAEFLEFIIKQVPLWIGGIFIITVSFIIARIFANRVENKLSEKVVEQDHQELQVLGGRITYVGIVILGITSGLKVAGIDITSIIAAGAFGIGFALKDLIMNFLAGIMILISRHFTIGDFIEINGTLGKVEDIQSRVTILKSTDGTKVIVPNSDLFKKQVVSFTSNPLRRFSLAISIDYRNNLENSMEIALDAVKRTKGVLLEPKPGVVVTDFGDNGVSLKVKAWCESKSGWVKVKSRVATNIKKAFDSHGIVIPWPIRVNTELKGIDEKKLKADAAPTLTPTPTPTPTTTASPAPAAPISSPPIQAPMLPNTQQQA